MGGQTNSGGVEMWADPVAMGIGGISPYEWYNGSLRCPVVQPGEFN